MTFTPSMNDGHHVFVFGSNLAGRHGAGAALQAKMFWQAQNGVGAGPTGSAYALPTMDEDINRLPLGEILGHVQDFIRYANALRKQTFLVTAVGTGLAGYSHEDIGPMFQNAPDNCVLPDEWRKYKPTTKTQHE